MAQRFLSHFFIRIGIVAAGKERLLAKEAFPTGHIEGDNNSIANAEIRYCWTELHDLTHELMAQDVACFHGRHIPVQQMHITSADGSGSDTDNGIARVDDFRVGDGIDADVILAVPA